MKKSDIILIGIVLFIAAIGFGIQQRLQGTNQELKVEVYWNNQLYGTWPLVSEEPVEIKLDSETGHNVVRIENGQADMIEADCPDKTCVRTRAISKLGQSIVCLPHKIVVQVVGVGEAEIDDISQ